MEDNIDMNNHQIKGLSDGNENNDAVNVKQLNEAENNVVQYVDQKITETNTNINSIVDQKIKESEEQSIISIEGENVFKKVMDDDLFKEDDDDIHKNGVVNKNYHKLNQKTYKFSIDYDSSIGYYSTRLSIDVVYLPINSYTMIYEMYVDDGITVSQIEASSGSLSVIKTTSKINGTNTRSVIQFRKNIIHPSFDDLDIDIQLKSKNDPQTVIYVIVYGVIGIHSDVPILVWDRLYYFDNDVINYETDIDMNKHRIKNLPIDYFYTDELKHDNLDNAKFLSFTSDYFKVESFGNKKYSKDIEILVAGVYQIIYCDYVKGSDGKLQIEYTHHDSGSIENYLIYSVKVIGKDDWTPLTINVIKRIDLVYEGTAKIYFETVSSDNTLKLRGNGYGSCFLKYLHE